MPAFRKDLSLSAVVSGLIVVLVGMTSSAVLVFQAARAFHSPDAESWLGSLCVGMGLLTIFFSLRYRAPIVLAWSTPGSVLLITAASDCALPQAIGAFLFSSFLIFVSGATRWFEKALDRIPVALTSALLAGVLLHFCLDAFGVAKARGLLIGSMFGAYLVGRKHWPRMAMLLALIAGVVVSALQGLFNAGAVRFAWTGFHAVLPEFSLPALLGLGLPLFVVTMASQNLTGISVLRSHRYDAPISPPLAAMGLAGMVTAFFGGFAINFAALTAAIAMGKDAHPDPSKRYVAGVVSGAAYVLIGLFAGVVTSAFAAFPQEMITAIAGFALLGTVSSGLSKAAADEAGFVTFAIAASGVSFLGIGSAFWAIAVGSVAHTFLNRGRVT